MRQNIRMWDRVVRWVLGFGLLSWAIAGGPFWAYFGLVSLATAVWGFSPVYFLLKTTAQR